MAKKVIQNVDGRQDYNLNKQLRQQKTKTTNLLLYKQYL